MKSIRAIGLAAAFLLLMSVAAAQSAPAAYRIDSIRFEIEGRTRESALVDAAELTPGILLADDDSLAAYIANKTQLLRNQRALESASIDYEVGEAAPGEPRPVRIVVRTKDTWNLVALPYFNYDSNTGLLLSMRGRDFNFLGTLTTLVLNVNWLFDTNGNQYPSLESSFSLPFKAAGLDWNWSVGASVVFPEAGPADMSATSTMVASHDLGPGKLGLTFSQAININDRNSVGAYFTDPVYLTSTAKLHYAMTLADAGMAGKLVATPFLSLSERWIFDGLSDTSLDTGPILTPGADITFGRINWHGNFRSGLTLALSADLNYYLARDSWSRIITASIAGYAELGGIFGPSARLTALYRPDSQDTSAGDALRGILDSRVDTDAALFLNVDLPFKVIEFKPADWFGKSWMRYFHFEQQWSPFVDLALGHFDGTWFDLSKGWYSGGLEVITYPSVARSFYVRISAGFDLAAVLANRSLSGTSPRDGASVRELYIGLGHLY